MMTIEVEIRDADGEVMEVVSLPAVHIVCPDCEGHGTVLNASMRHHAYTQEEFDQFSDEEKEEYFKQGGAYDVTCPTCNGRNVVKVVDRDRMMSDRQRAALKKLDADAEDDAAYERLCRMERMMGA